MTSCTKVIWTVLIAVGLAGACLPGCGSKRPNTGGSKQPARRAARISTVPSDEECRQFAAAVEEAVQSGDAEAFNAAIDWDALLERATAGIEVDEKMRRGFIAGCKRKAFSSSSLGQKVIQQLADGGSYSFVHVRSKGREKRVLFRVLTNSGLADYHEMIVSRQPDGQVNAVDIFFYTTSETFSKTLRRFFLPLAADASKSVLAKLTGEENDLVKNLGKLAQINDAMRQGRYRQVLDTCEQLPTSLKKDKNFLLIRLRAAGSVSEEEYNAAIKDFRTWHPRDPCVDLICLDQLILEERYEEALNNVKRLDAAVGPDPYLDVVRATIRLEQEQFAGAKQLANKAIEADDTLVDAYWALITVSLAEKDFDETNRLLNTLEEEFLMEFDDPRDVPEYAEYVKSPQYQQWLKSRRQQ